MIAHLRGTLLEKHPNQAIVETAGVGYDVTIPVSTFTKLPEAGAEVREAGYCGSNQEGRGPVTTTTDTRALDELCVNTIRTLSMDAVEKANSGHPGAPMGLAPLAYVLYTRVMRHNPSNADWPGRARFILSAGHASMLL